MLKSIKEGEEMVEFDNFIFLYKTLKCTLFISNIYK